MSIRINKVKYNAECKHQSQTVKHDILTKNVPKNVASQMVCHCSLVNIYVLMLLWDAMLCSITGHNIPQGYDLNIHAVRTSNLTYCK